MVINVYFEGVTFQVEEFKLGHRLGCVGRRKNGTGD